MDHFWICLVPFPFVGHPILRNGERYGDEGKAGDWMRRMGECGSLITPQMLGWVHPTTFTMHQINQKAKVAFILDSSHLEILNQVLVADKFPRNQFSKSDIKALICTFHTHIR